MKCLQYMALEKICWLLVVYAVFYYASSAIAEDVVHNDDSTPKKPVGCNNQFVLVFSFHTKFSFSAPFLIFL